TSITLPSPGQDIVAFNFTASIASLSNGIHRLFVRSVDADGKWSIVSSRMFYKEAALSKTLAKVNKMEYFFDTDPGVGSGNNISFTPGQDVSFTFNPMIVSLSTSAFHRLFIRSRDSNGLWSITTSQLFYIPASLPPAPVKLTKLEYFIDNDPGFGMGTNVPFTSGFDVTINFTAPISALNNGIHRLVVRSQDSVGRWSHSSTQMFYKEAVLSASLANITAAEYFIDTDPGIGMGTNISISAGQDITFAFSSSLTGISAGIHRLFVRTKDANGKWSLTQPQMFYYEPVLSHPLANIVAAEYFIDTDPGIGAATSVSFTSGQDVSFAFTGSLTGVSHGLHRLFVRTKDANGKWSHTQAQMFYFEPVLSHPLANIVAAEYFFDTDPGIGNATAATVTAGQDINIPITAAISSLSAGIHRLLVRTKDANGKWSHSIPQLFYKESVLSHTPGYLSQLEYFWDVDTGFGNNTAVSVPPSTVDLVGHTFTVIVPSGFVGKHYLYIRAKDDWGLTTVKEIIFPSSSLPVTLLDFRAQKVDIKVQLSWNVAHEQGMAKYVVERSRNAKDFDSIGTVKATGASDYELYDPKPYQGLNFYRLRQVENSGQSKYSATVTILFSEMASSLSVYPNPATDHFSINASKALSSVTLTDLNGKSVRKYDVTGNYSLGGIASGVYIVQVLDADGVVILKPLVVK
ncbi:MAG: T9SS type A sorting domain-containing protein, partial [Bacteroidetes bacterium]|nr:T9SS type A sorting domain-containing protein [Bacteroidota bacterium]